MILANVSCDDIGFIVRILAKLLKYIHYLVPMLLIVLVIIDIAKLVITNPDDKAKSTTFSKIGKRVIYSIIIFLLPTILFFIFDRIKGIGDSDSHSDVNSTSWYGCFRSAYRN